MGINFESSRSVAEMDGGGVAGAGSSAAAVEAALQRLANQRAELGELWAARKLRLDLALRLRIFERDALEVSIVCFIKKLSKII